MRILRQDLSSISQHAAIPQHAVHILLLPCYLLGCLPVSAAGLHEVCQRVQGTLQVQGFMCCELLDSLVSGEILTAAGSLQRRGSKIATLWRCRLPSRTAAP